MVTIFLPQFIEGQGIATARCLCRFLLASIRSTTGTWFGASPQQRRLPAERWNLDTVQAAGAVCPPGAAGWWAGSLTSAARRLRQRGADELKSQR